MEKIGFNSMLLLEVTGKIGEKYICPKPDSFNNISESFNILVDDNYYEVTVEKNETYIWFDINFGSPTPRGEELTNITTGDKKLNPRKNIEAELLKQLFCLYYFPNQTLYLSNSKKKKFIEVVLREKVGSDFIVKNFCKTKDEFIDIINNINEISFTEVKNLFHKNSKERQALIDLTGTDSSDDFSIIAKYTKENKVVNFLHRLFDAKSNNSLKDLVIRGTDEDNFNIIFNNDTFIKKIDIQSPKDINGKFTSISVKASLLQELRR